MSTNAGGRARTGRLRSTTKASSRTNWTCSRRRSNRGSTSSRKRSRQRKMEAVEQAIQSLKPRQRALLEGYYFDNRSMRELAKQLGYSNEYVAKSTKKRIINTIRETIEQQERANQSRLSPAAFFIPSTILRRKLTSCRSKHSVAHHSALSTGASTLSRVTMRYPAEESTLSRVTMRYPAEESTLSRVTMRYPAEVSTLSRVTMHYPAEESTLSRVIVRYPLEQALCRASQCAIRWSKHSVARHNALSRRRKHSVAHHSALSAGASILSRVIVRHLIEESTLSRDRVLKYLRNPFFSPDTFQKSAGKATFSS